MSIEMEQPSLVINSDDVPGPNYRMQYTWNAPEGITTTSVVNRIIEAGNDITPYGSSGVKALPNVIINCHGDPGKLYVGGVKKAPITLADVGAFSKIYDTHRISIGTMWLVACEAARGATGKQFCGQLAMKAKCNVVASDEDQEVELSYILFSHNIFTIDDFEGNVFLFDWTNGSFKAYSP
jgi:hypothetical protein